MAVHVFAPSVASGLATPDNTVVIRSVRNNYLAISLDCFWCSIKVCRTNCLVFTQEQKQRAKNKKYIFS